MGRHVDGEHEGGYGTAVVVEKPFPEAVAATRQALVEQGFGVLTEIDLAATMREKLQIEMPPQLILGACNPPLAHRALQAEPAVALLLPCNVTLRSISPERTEVAALDPQVMVGVTGNQALSEVADDAAAQLRAVLAAVATQASAA